MPDACEGTEVQAELGDDCACAHIRYGHIGSYRHILRPHMAVRPYSMPRLVSEGVGWYRTVSDGVGQCRMMMSEACLMGVTPVVEIIHPRDVGHVGVAARFLD